MQLIIHYLIIILVQKWIKEDLTRQLKSNFMFVEVNKCLITLPFKANPLLRVEDIQV